jgi:hypothetical protein
VQLVAQAPVLRFKFGDRAQPGRGCGRTAALLPLLQRVGVETQFASHLGGGFAAALPMLDRRAFERFVVSLPGGF